MPRNFCVRELHSGEVWNDVRIFLRDGIPAVQRSHHLGVLLAHLMIDDLDSIIGISDNFCVI